MQGRCKMASALLSQKLYLRLDRGEFMITIKDNIIKLDFHEETLHCDITQMARNGLGSIIISLILSIMEKMCFFQRLKTSHIKDMIQE